MARSIDKMDETPAAQVADPRRQRGLALARAKAQKIRRVAGDTWLVPSQTGASGGYVVDVVRETCSCPDHEDRQVRCKHLWAVAYVRREVTAPDGTTTVTEAVLAAPVADDAGAEPAPRPTYTQDWPAYHRAQCEEQDVARHRVVKYDHNAFGCASRWATSSTARR